ncbi:MAG TPA: hypothetical protein VHX60_00955 [Acidobacteriaceae bacterium]|nr:hypothetical protein [Acidobacteriaceae bacterium]
MSGNLSYDQMLDLTIEDLKRNPRDLSRIGMLVDAYFPEARPDYDRLIESGDSLNEVALKHKLTYFSGNRNGEGLRGSFTLTMNRVDSSGKAFGEIILNAIRAYSRDDSRDAVKHLLFANV